MTELDELRAAFCTACEVIQELAHKISIVESWQDVLSEMASHTREKAMFLSIQHGQIVGKPMQEKRNVEQECDVLRKQLSVMQTVLHQGRLG